MRSAISAVLIHDMKNIGFRLNLLRTNLDEHYGDPDLKKSATDLLRSTVEKIDAIVGCWSDHEDFVLIKTTLDLNDLLREVIRSGRMSSRARQNVEIEALLMEIPTVWGDAYYLTDSLASVYANAVEAASAGGSLVTVRTGVERKKKRSYALIEISDDGPGISPDFARDHLFRPFQTTKAGGVGLGLYTARQIIEFHGGRLELRSRPGSGTMARILLPAASGAS